MAVEPNKRFLRSFEGEQHDCGLFLGPMALEGNLTDRVFGFARTLGLEEAYARMPALKDGIIIPMDIKNPGPIGDQSPGAMSSPRHRVRSVRPSSSPAL